MAKVNNKANFFLYFKSQLRRKLYKCYTSKNYNDFIIDDIGELDPNVFAFDSGPDTGICDLDLTKNFDTNRLKQYENFNKTECLESLIRKGLLTWPKKHHKAYGISTSLYEYNPITKQTVGEPIADTFAILARNNSCIMLMADGVNWGVKSRRAARCAVRAALYNINKSLFNEQKCQIKTTHDIFRILSKAFDESQALILKKEGSMTTLCCSIVVQLKDSSHNLSTQNLNKHESHFVVCTLSIGDSTAYVYNRDKASVFELTKGTRNVQNDRDMRDVGGALGYVYGNKPDLSNITYSQMYIKQNDIVFLVSDGISDNFDPVISGVAVKKRAKCDNEIKKSEDLPEMDPYERYLCSIKHMEEILNRNISLNETISAQETCAMIMEHVVKLTEKKRQLLENGFIDVSNLTNDGEKLKYQMKLRDQVQKLNGKLDHASIVAVEI